MDPGDFADFMGNLFNHANDTASNINPSDLPSHQDFDVLDAIYKAGSLYEGKRFIDHRLKKANESPKDKLLDIM